MSVLELEMCIGGGSKSKTEKFIAVVGNIAEDRGNSCDLPNGTIDALLIRVCFGLAELGEQFIYFSYLICLLLMLENQKNCMCMCKAYHSRHNWGGKNVMVTLPVATIGLDYCDSYHNNCKLNLQFLVIADFAVPNGMALKSGGQVFLNIVCACDIKIKNTIKSANFSSWLT